MNVILDHEKHEYHTEVGQLVPGFSEVLASVGTRKRDESGEWGRWLSISGEEFCSYEVAQAFGHAIHGYAAFRLLGVDCEYDPQIRPWVRGLEKYIGAYGLAEHIPYQYVEKSMYSQLYGYAGTPDLFWYNEKELHIFDWKTATSMQLTKWRMQSAAYAQLVLESLFPNDAVLQLPHARVIRHHVRIYEDGYQEDVRRGHSEDWYQWLGVLNVYKIAA